MKLFGSLYQSTELRRLSYLIGDAGFVGSESEGYAGRGILIEGLVSRLTFPPIHFLILLYSLAVYIYDLTFEGFPECRKGNVNGEGWVSNPIFPQLYSIIFPNFIINGNGVKVTFTQQENDGQPLDQLPKRSFTRIACTSLAVAISTGLK